jgi:hypothetical protein
MMKKNRLWTSEFFRLLSTTTKKDPNLTSALFQDEALLHERYLPLCTPTIDRFWGCSFCQTPLVFYPTTGCVVSQAA